MTEDEHTTPADHVCAICLTSIAPEDAPVACPACQAPYHLECWTENGGCGVYGCQHAPEVQLRTAMEIPVSYWGQEDKPCPACRRNIAAAAVRCRHCGATFSNAQPQEAESYQAKAALTARLPALRRTVIILFVLCALPFTAPLGAVGMTAWYSLRHRQIGALQSFYDALCKIGLLLGWFETVIILLMCLAYQVKHGL